MRIYTKTPQYVIWENKDFTYQIQMIGKDVDSKVCDAAKLTKKEWAYRVEDLVNVGGLF